MKSETKQFMYGCKQFGNRRVLTHWHSTAFPWRTHFPSECSKKHVLSTPKSCDGKTPWLSISPRSNKNVCLIVGKVKQSYYLTQWTHRIPVFNYIYQTKSTKCRSIYHTWMLWVKLYNAVYMQFAVYINRPVLLRKIALRLFPLPFRKKTPKGTFDLLTKIQKENKSTIHLFQVQLRT